MVVPDGLITQLAPPTPSPPSTRLHAYNFPTEGFESAAAVCVVSVVVRPRSGAPDRQWAARALCWLVYLYDTLEGL